MLQLEFLSSTAAKLAGSLNRGCRSDGKTAGGDPALHPAQEQLMVSELCQLYSFSGQAKRKYTPPENCKLSRTAPLSSEREAK